MKIRVCDHCGVIGRASKSDPSPNVVEVRVGLHNGGRIIGARRAGRGLVGVIRASNTNRVLGFRLGHLSVLGASEGHVDWYRNGYVVRLYGRKIGFVPTSRYHASSVR